MSKLALEWIEQCKHCNGTGLFIGMGEMAGREDYGGAAVVCNKCKGTGRMEMRHAITALPTVLSCRLIQSSRCHRKACNVVEVDRQETAHKYGATKFRLRVH